MFVFLVIVVMTIGTSHGLKVPLSSIYRVKPSEYQWSHTNHYGTSTNNDQEKSSQRINFLLTKVVEIITAMTPSLRKKTTNPSAVYDQDKNGMKNESSSSSNETTENKTEETKPKKESKKPVALSFSASHRQMIELLNR